MRFGVKESICLNVWGLGYDIWGILSKICWSLHNFEWNLFDMKYLLPNFVISDKISVNNR